MILKREDYVRQTSADVLSKKIILRSAAADLDSPHAPGQQSPDRQIDVASGVYGPDASQLGAKQAGR